MFTDGRQHLSYHTLQHHQAPHCTSDLLYKGALQGSSRIVWRGMIKVDRDAQKTDGYQRDDNLILSESSRADSIPGLEIEADDVKCSHGATAGRVDDEQVFYASTRGLTAQRGHPHDRHRILPAGLRPHPHRRASVTRWARRSAAESANSSKVRASCQTGKPAMFVGKRDHVRFHPPLPGVRHSRGRPKGLRDREAVRRRLSRGRRLLRPGRLLHARRRAAGRRKAGGIRGDLPAARGEVRHPRRPGADACPPSRPRHPIEVKVEGGDVLVRLSQ